MTVAGPNLPNYTRSNAVSIITWTIQNASCQFNFTVLHNCKVPYSLEVTRDDYISEAKPVTVLYEQHRDKQTGHVVAGWLALTHSQSVAQNSEGHHPGGGEEWHGLGKLHHIASPGF